MKKEYTWLMVENEAYEKYMRVWDKLLIVWNTPEVVDEVLLWRIPFDTVWETKQMDKVSLDEIMWIREDRLFDTWFFEHVCIKNEKWKFEDVPMANILLEN